MVPQGEFSKSRNPILRSSLDGKSCPRLKASRRGLQHGDSNGMDELAAAAAVANMSIDDGVAAEQDPLQAVEAQAAADVLRTINMNTRTR